MNSVSLTTHRSTMLVPSAPRPTPETVDPPFASVLARTLMSGAQAATTLLPGGPLVAAATRGSIASLSRNADSAGGSTSAEGPSSPGGAGATGDLGLEASMARSYDMNMQLLRVQEEVSARNRVFSTLSNVMKAEHDTLKTAIGNIR